YGDGTSALFNANNDPVYRNNLLLDLNAGLDPNAFADKVGRVVNVYGGSESTYTFVREQRRFGRSVLPFTPYLPNLTWFGETYYTSEKVAGNGDGFMPLESTARPFWGDARFQNYGFYKGWNTSGSVDHYGLMANKDALRLIAGKLGVFVSDAQISTG